MLCSLRNTRRELRTAHVEGRQAMSWVNPKRRQVWIMVSSKRQERLGRNVKSSTAGIVERETPGFRLG
jgi:hypothetical protein